MNERQQFIALLDKAGLSYKEFAEKMGLQYNSMKSMLAPGDSSPKPLPKWAKSVLVINEALLNQKTTNPMNSTRMLAIRHKQTGEVFGTASYFENGVEKPATSYDHVLQRYNELGTAMNRLGGIVEPAELSQFDLGTVVSSYDFTSQMEESFIANQTALK